MTSREFVFVRIENYVKEQPKASEVLQDPTFTVKSKLMILLQRSHPPQVIGKVEVKDERMSEIEKKVNSCELSSRIPLDA